MGYYKEIDGNKYDGAIIALADEAVAGQGDGRISKADADKMLAAVKDANSYTEIEKATMRYVRDNYKWTDEADSQFRNAINAWNLEGHA